MTTIPETFRQYLQGMGIFDAQRPVTDCTTERQRTGWWAAFDAKVDAEMPASEEPGYGYDYATIHGPRWA